jgi:hypothetical protein
LQSTDAGQDQARSLPLLAESGQKPSWLRKHAVAYAAFHELIWPLSWSRRP